VDIRKVTEDASVTGQVHPREMPQISALGFRSVICNRPDGEAEDQPLFASIEAAGRDSDLTVHYIPVSGAVGVQPADVDALAQLWADLPKPVLAYCRSGARSTTLIQAAMARVDQSR
jgi:sulfide:quinone oxidoreductase